MKKIQSQSYTDRIQFFAFSADKPPGKGIGDIIKNPDEYKELRGIKNWRRIFSSLWSCLKPISYNDLKYSSFEHAFQSAKFIITGHTQVGHEFSLNSGSDLSKSDGKTAFRNRKRIVLTSEDLAKWRQSKSGVKDEIAWAKYTQILIAKKALLATQNAELWNKGPRIREIRCYRTEKIRKRLSVDSMGSTNKLEQTIGRVSRSDKPVITITKSSPTDSKKVTIWIKRGVVHIQ